MTFSQQLRELFSTHREPSLDGTHVVQEQLAPLLEEFKDYAECTIDLLGQSAEQRHIHLIRWGHGPKKIMMWSQMHGDEPTATRAIFDLLNFLLREVQHDLPYQLQQALTIYFIPLLNPDGAARNWRYNAWGIDLNRDAAQLQTPEARLLKNISEVVAPQYAFNLHDQYSYYSAGMHHLPAAISFLANPIDRERSVPPHRRESMQLIAHINKGLQELAPSQVGRYMSDFDPTSFGDTFQARGICTMLVEAGGGWEANRSLARELNFVALLLALNAIASDTHLREDYALYEQIPENKLRLYDFIIRNVRIPAGSNWIKADVAVNFERSWHENHWQIKKTVANFGDLSSYHGLNELNGEGHFLHTPTLPSPTLQRDKPALFFLQNEAGEKIWEMEQ